MQAVVVAVLALAISSLGAAPAAVAQMAQIFLDPSIRRRVGHDQL